MPKQAVAVDEAGRPIAESDLPQALSEGRAFVGPDDDVYMSDATGQPVVVKGKDVAHAFKSGFGLRPQAALDEESAQAQRAERMTPGEAVKAAVEGNLRGMTFGLSDPALTSLLGPDYAKAARERREAHGPLAAPLELSGTLGTSIGIGAVAPASTLPRLAALGAAEGAAYDAGMEMSSAALENRELTADKLLAAAGHGALLGGGGALVLGAGGSALSRAGRRVLNDMAGGRSLSESVEAFANRRMLGERAAVELADDPARADRVLQKLEARGILNQTPVAAEKALATEINATIRRLGDVNVELAKAGAAVEAQPLATALERHVTDLKRVPLNEFHVAATDLAEAAAPLSKLAGPQLLFSEVFPVAEKVGALAAQAAKRKAPEAVELLAARDTLEQALIASADATPHGPVLRAVLEDLRDLRTARKVLSGKPAEASVSDLVSGALASMATGSPVAGAATAIGRRLLRDKSPAMVAKVARLLAKTERRIAHGVSAAIEGKAIKRPAAAPTAVARAVTYNARREQLDKKLEQIRAIKANPKEAAQRLGDATADVAEWSPELAEALQQRILRGAAFLEARLPVILQRANLSPLAVKPRIPPLELRRTLEYVEALEDPLSVLEDLANGHLPRRKIEALREVHPELYSDLRMRILNELTAREKPIPYNRRIMLSLTFDLQGDTSLEPGYLGRIQRSFAPPEEREPGKPAADIDAESVVNNLETQTQRLESGSPLP